MTGMTRKGPDRRAVELRSAANRYRWETDLALGLWPNAHNPTATDHEQHHLLTGDVRERFATLLAHYRAYHRTPR